MTIDHRNNYISGTYARGLFDKNGAIWCVLVYILIRFCLKTFLKIICFAIRNNNYSYALAMGCLTSYKNNYIRCIDVRGLGGTFPENNDAIWCVLMYILIKFCLKKILIFYIKTNITATSLL